jgi:heavy metal sensor kinase
VSLRRIPIRWRLTAWYAAILTVVIALFGLVIYTGLRHELNDNLHEQLAAETSLIAGAVQIVDGGPVLDWQDSQDPYEEQFARLWAADGALILDSANLPANPAADQPLLDKVTSGAVQNGSVERLGQRYLTRAQPLYDGPTLIGVLQVGHTTKDNADILRALIRLFLIAAPIVLAAAIWSGYLFAGRALRPVQSITALARDLDEADLSARLNLDLPNDELGQLATTFDAMLDRIDRAFDRQRRFASDAAHELRTPIGLMRSRVDVVLARDRTEEHYRAELERLRTELTRLSELAAALLTIAHVDAGQTPVSLSEFDLAPVAESVLTQFRAIATGSSPELTSRMPPTVVYADQDLMIQVLVNLVANAVAHTPAGGRVTVGVSQTTDVTLVWVEDTGCGIPSALRERVFDRFFRIDTGRTRAQGGAGLGLSICRLLMEAQGGSIRVAERSGPGTHIEIGLPGNPAPP